MMIEILKEKIEGYYITGELISIDRTNKNNISVEIKDILNKENLVCKIKNTDLAMQLVQHLHKKIGCYGVATLHNDKIKQFTIDEFYVKKDLDNKGLFYGISKTINDSSVKNLLEQDDLSKYFKNLKEKDVF